MRALLAAGFALAAVPAGAQETTLVVQARAAGLIGERFDGYVGVVTAPSPALRTQVAAINIKRRSLFSNFAASRGVAAQEVGITAACTLLGRVRVGEVYMLGDGRWRRRTVSQAAPRPDYCG
ncbi:MAG TPA: YdbL family protein [Sphingomicrobium sp.]|nr:YdbL family protein [Sphingomicrobium sp.]